MPYKRTGNPNGRPRADRNLPLISVDVVSGTAEFNAPAWWVVMAHREAELRHAGQWKQGSRKLLAGQFILKLTDQGKSLAAVHKVRHDARYKREVDRHICALELQAHQDALSPDGHTPERADLRADILAAMREVSDGEE